MAHYDHDCCAVCDNEQDHNGVCSATKEDICSGCRRALQAAGVLALNAEELVVWIEEADSAEVKRVLGEVGFSRCRYDNRVDAAAEKAIGEAP